MDDEQHILQLSNEINDLRCLLETTDDRTEYDRLSSSINELVMLKIALFERIHNHRLNSK